jgi:beta-N-acetylhexosaminidase
MTDDLSMGALTGSIADRTRQSLAAGCDLVLHCNGNLSEMDEVASHCPELGGDALARAAKALASRRPADDIDLDEARTTFAAMLSGSVAG